MKKEVPALRYGVTCLEAATAALRERSLGHIPSPTTVHLRRKHDRVRQFAVYDNLYHDFLPPIDREDLWHFCLLCDRILTATEFLTDKSQIVEFLPLYETIETAVNAFADSPRNEVCISHCKKALFSCLEQERKGDDPAVLSACRDLLEFLLFVLLKNA